MSKENSKNMQGHLISNEAEKMFSYLIEEGIIPDDDGAKPDGFLKLLTTDYPAVPNDSMLDEGLKKYTMKQLNRIRVKWGIKGTSGLRKMELIERIEDHIYDYQHTLGPTLSLDDIQALAGVSANEPDLYIINPAVTNLLERGLLFKTLIDGQTRLQVPLDISMLIMTKVIDDAYLDRLQRIEEIRYIVNGLVILYGVIDHLDLLRIIQEHYVEDCEIEELIHVLWSDHHANVMVYDLGLAHYEIIENPIDLYEEVSERDDLDYAIYPKEDVMIFGSSGSLQYNQASQKKFINMMTEFMETDLDAMSLFHEIVEARNFGGGSSEIIQPLFDVIELDHESQIQPIINLLTHALNDTPTWLTKGHSPSNLARRRGQGRLIHLSQEKIGRNAPCPCGSGKKYKKCCLNK